MSEIASVASDSLDSSPPDEREHELNDFLKPLIIDDDHVFSLAYRFSKVYAQVAQTSEEQFIPTPVTKLPSGQEVGQYLAIDVGGTNLRVGWIELMGDVAEPGTLANGVERSRETIRNAQRPRLRRTLEKAWPIGEHLKMDKTEDLFAWIGDCIAEVVSDRLSNDAGRARVPDELDMGITFSFPMEQTSLATATLMPTGKGFKISSDLDLGSNLLQGYERHTRASTTSDSTSPPRSKRRRLGPLPRLRICAITNDTVATLASLAYSVKSLPNSRVAAGIIVGTGVNATIPMRLADLGETKEQTFRKTAPDAHETIVNTELTIGGTCGPLDTVQTKWDVELDHNCARPGFQPLEYMTGGRYIGELIRIIFYDYMTARHNPPVPTESLPAATVHPYSFGTAFVSAVVARAKSDTELATELKRRMAPPESSSWTWSAHSAGALRRISQAVQVRSAGLIAASTVGLLCTVGEISLPKPNGVFEATAPSQGADTPMTDAAAPHATPEGTHPDNGHDLPHRSPKPLSTKTSSATASLPQNPEELVIAYTGGIIQHYPNFKEQAQRFIDRLVMRAGPQAGGKSVLLREARDGGIIGAGVLCAMESIREKVAQA